jgi:Gpi18-like mannosyltransferase
MASCHLYEGRVYYKIMVEDKFQTSERRKTKALPRGLTGPTSFVLGAILLIGSLAARIAIYPTIVSDYTYFVAKWFAALQSSPGLSAFRIPFSDYPPLYLYLIKLLTFIPVSSLYSVKTLSLGADIAITIAIILILRDAKGTRPGLRMPWEKLFLAGAIVLSIPTIVINSSLWGQADAFYTAAILFSILFILRDKPFLAAVAYAISFCFKVQSVFFLPILIGYYLRAPKRLLYLALIPVIYIASVIPAWLSGGSLSYLLGIYLHQGSEYTSLNMSSASIFAFIEKFSLSTSLQDVFFWTGLFLALLAALSLAWLTARRTHALSGNKLLLLALISASIIPFFLPRMHERYFYLADALSVLIALYSPRRWYLPILFVSASLLSYMPFLSSQVSWLSFAHVDLRIPSSLLIIGILLSIHSLIVIRKEETHDEAGSRGSLSSDIPQSGVA